MGLNPKQKEAVEYLNGPLLVLAGPGTGKTQLLSEKVSYILQNTDTNPENILCLTFTDSATANMRERLKTIIGKDGLKVNIGTYHSFGSEILAQYKNYSEEYDRKLDSAIDDVTKFKIVKSIRDSLPGTDILRGDNVKDIISVISAAKGANLSADDLLKVAEQNIADSEVLSEAISPLLMNVVPRVFKASYENAYKPIYEILKDYTVAEPILPRVERSIAGLARDLEKAMAEAEEKNGISPLSKWKEDYFEKDGRGNYRLQDRVRNKKLKSAAFIMQKYQEYLLAQGLYDFDDMIQEAVKILKNDTGFRLTLSERYQFIMLDEFQDTNPSQFAIVKALTDYEKPLIMAVGDDDQAIYEFQGALSTNLTDFKEHYNAHVVKLVENYRSTQEILDFSRKIINQAPDRFDDKELISHKDSPKNSQIYRYEFLSSDMEYGFVAKKIDELIKSGVSQSEIAVISYKTKYFMPLLPYLKAYPDIKIAYEKRDNLLEDEQIHELLTLSRYVYELANERKEDVSILEILAYPFFNLPMLKVLKAVERAKASKKSIFTELSADESSEITEVANFIANLVAKSLTEPLNVFMDYLIGTAELNGYRSPFLEYYAKKGGYSAFTLYENLAALKGKLTKHYGEKSLKLADLIAMVDDYGEADIAINTSSPYRDADEAVQILSAHKAKGLEFEYVFIISADNVAWGKGKGNNNLLMLPKNLAEIRHTGMTDGEKLRILYVALTRAKNTIFITNSLHDFNEKSPDRLEYLGEYTKKDENGNEEVISPLLPSGKVNLMYQWGAGRSSVDDLKNWLSPYIEASPDLESLYRERVCNWRMSASSLTTFIDIVYSGPTEFFNRVVLRAPQGAETEEMAFGDLIHKTFEAVTKQNLSDEQALEFFANELNKKELPVETISKLREKGLSDLAISLKKFGEILHDGKAEISLSSENPTVDGVPVTGIIDHMKIDEAAKTIEIYDFKTGAYHSAKWHSRPTLYKYMLQLIFYKLLLNNSPTYKNYKVVRSHILFVSPDKDGEVYDKVYEFDEADEKELVSLIKSVYTSVMTLDFIKDKEIFIPPDDRRGIKDIRDFVSLMLAKNAKK